MVEDRSSRSSTSASTGSANPTSTQHGKKGGAASGVVPASYLEPGARLEAKDPVNDQWFPVKVTDEDKEAKEVRVQLCLRLHQSLINSNVYICT